jgi:hypothetical protein
MSAATDSAAGLSGFFGTVITKFTPEGFNTLRTYLETTPDVKNVVNLLLRATRFVDAGLEMAGSAMDPNLDPPEKQSKLMVRSLGAHRCFLQPSGVSNPSSRRMHHRKLLESLG